VFAEIGMLRELDDCSNRYRKSVTDRKETHIHIYICNREINVVEG